MKKIYPIIGIIAIIAFAIFILSVAHLGPLASDKDPKQSIREFTGDPAAVVIFQKRLGPNLAGDFVDTYTVDKDLFYIDPSSGDVIGASFHSTPITKNKNLTLEQSEIFAKDYATRHFNNFTTRNMQLTRDVLLDHGDRGSEYSFTWNEQSQKTNVGNYFDVSINSDGEILSFLSRDKPTPSIEPSKIGKDQAIAIATNYVIEKTKISNITSNETKSAQLVVMPGMFNRAVWEIELKVSFVSSQNDIEPFRGGFVYVDGTTGEVVKFESYL